ncbi:MAG: ribosome small subunit-dependent GTPase A [Oscillospiraceae bacterium]|nr:ribosome small subunit-dependent GTPase A [Oscillospiraceae bacterium]
MSRKTPKEKTSPTLGQKSVGELCIKGMVIKAMSGLYTVRTDEGDYRCSVRGIMRKHNMTPFCGDNVMIEITDQADSEGIISEILPRRNSFKRPPLANIDLLIFVVSSCEPMPNTLIIDKLIAIAEYKDINPVLILTKLDLDNLDNLEEIYSSCGFDVMYNTETDRIKSLLSGKVSALAGNTGVGKSTLLNNLGIGLDLSTGEVSKKLGRGRHTTRHVELFALGCGGYVGDTPGFSTVDPLAYDSIDKQDLHLCFREFAPYIEKCKFSGCSHTVEKGCAVLQALSEGKIHPSRHKSYVEMRAAMNG